MVESNKISSIGSDQTISLAMDTIQKGKQAIIFVNTKRGAEKTAEDLSKKIKDKNRELEELSERAHKSLSRPTKQCTRLSKCIKKGVAFHHAGLTQKQKDIIQDNFLAGKIKVIAATPTLAAGVDLPAYRAIIRDAKRFTRGGMKYIPVLEYMQMAGRAGRPSFDSYGEAILIAKSDAEKEELVETYVYGVPENIYSKLAVEPVLRFYLLSLISGNFVRTKEQIMDFFSRTFWAYQYGDMRQLEAIIDKMLELLIDFDFLESSEPKDDFVSASDMSTGKYTATKLGRRVAELYLDPVTANDIIQAMKRIDTLKPDIIAYLQLFSFTNEIKPPLRVKVREFEHYQDLLVKIEDELVVQVPTPFDYEYDEFLSSIKMASFFYDWIEEESEEILLEKYDIRPGEIKYKLDIVDWLIYSAVELSKILSMRDVYKEMTKLRTRVKNGAKEELLPLLKLKNVGRMRARKLFRAKITDVGGIKKADVTTLSELLGPKLAVDLKEQVGEVVKEIPKKKRKGQMSLTRY